VLHEFQTIVCQDVTVVVPHPSEGVHQPMLIPAGEAEERAGCKNCNMGLEEALTLPCPGVPLESMME
jgi:hypothetical protein